MRAVTTDDLAALAQALGDTPQTLIPLHLLRQRLAAGWLTGTPSDLAALVVQHLTDPAEPSAFGHNAAAIWTILQSLSGWTCVNVPLPLVEPLRALMLTAYPSVRVYGDVYYTLAGDQAAVPVPEIETRLMLPGDPLLESGDAMLQTTAWPTTRHMLTEGAFAVGIDGGRVVATAHITAVSARYADVGVFTLPDYRGRGLSTYAASLVMREAIRRGLTPAWSTGEDNVASQRVAEKLGLSREPTHRAYLIPQP